MPRLLPSGVYQRPRRWATDASSKVPFQAALFDQDADDMAAAISETPTRTEMAAAIDNAVTGVLAGQVTSASIDNALGYHPANPFDYYNRAATDAIFAPLTAVAASQGVQDVRLNALESALPLKADDVAVTAALAGKAAIVHDHNASYYTKPEVDTLVAGAGTFNPANYYDKLSSDARYYLKSQVDTTNAVQDTRITAVETDLLSKADVSVVDSMVSDVRLGAQVTTQCYTEVDDGFGNMIKVPFTAITPLGNVITGFMTTPATERLVTHMVSRPLQKKVSGTFVTVATL